MAPSIAVVGGGPSGLSMAALLEKHGYDYVLYERARADVPPRGGCLDLHYGSGQRVIREAGLVDKFEAAARRGAATVHKLYDEKLTHLFSWGDGRDAPEIDRGQLRDVLLSGINSDRIQYSKNVESAERDENGEVVLEFSDGTKASGFKLVIGADGTFSKVRKLVTDTEPVFVKQFMFTAKYYQTNPFYPELESKAGLGPMIIMGKYTNIWLQRQGDGSYQADFATSGEDKFALADRLDLRDLDALKKLLLQKEWFGHFETWAQDLIQHAEPHPDGSIRRWVLYAMPVDKINWEPAQGVTLIGDAVHSTTPYVGEGVNYAMRDACLLVAKLNEYGISQQAIAEYEKEMFPFAIDLITRSLKSGEMFYSEDAGRTFTEDAGRTFTEVMKSKHKLVGITDYI